MNKWLVAVFVVIGLFLIASLVSSVLFNDNKFTGNTIIVVPLDGVITTQGSGGSLFEGSGVSSTELIKKIKELNEDSSIKGVIFEIDSPGGTVVASQEISDAVKELKKPKYAVIREVGASGAYWVASATDKIIASPMSITGSIGVLGSYLEFSKLFEKYGVTYERFTGGEFKDLGSPYKIVSEEERKLLQGKIDLVHDYFIKEVAKNRKMDEVKVRKLATGEFYLGQEAKDLGLIDELGNRETAINEMKKQLNLTDVNIEEMKEQPNLFQALGQLFAYSFGRGFAAELNKLNLENQYKISA